MTFSSWPVKGTIDRMTLPLLFRYSYLSENAIISYTKTRLLLMLWILLDIVLQSWLSPWTWYFALMSISAYVLAWKAPPLMGAAIAGVQLTRVLVSFLILFFLYSGVSKSVGPWLEGALLGLQVWILIATLGLILKYIQTPKKKMASQIT